MTSLLRFIVGLRESLGLLLSLIGVLPTLLSATLHLDTSDLVQSGHKHPALMRQGLAVGTPCLCIHPAPLTIPKSHAGPQPLGKGQSSPAFEVGPPPPVMVNICWCKSLSHTAPEAPGTNGALSITHLRHNSSRHVPWIAWA